MMRSQIMPLFLQSFIFMTFLSLQFC